MNILGINVYHGDASACLVQDGRLIVACEEERFNRIKHCAGLPLQAIQYCLSEAMLNPGDISAIAVSRNPYANLAEKVMHSIAQAMRNQTFLRSRVRTLGKVTQIKQDLGDALGWRDAWDGTDLVFVEHHLAHMASSFFVSPFREAALLSLDGFGDFVSTKIGAGNDRQLETYGQITFPHSCGILYTATSQFIGFPKFGDEGKVMGLAPYGVPRYLEKFRNLVQWDGNWKFKLNLDYFRHHNGSLQMSWTEGTPHIELIFSDKFRELFGNPRLPNEPLTQHQMDIAASLQAMLEEIYFRIVNYLYEYTQLPNLCLAGGVALNSVCNGKLWKQSKFRQVYIQAAAGDGGTCVGAAYYLWNQMLSRPRGPVMHTPYTGAQFDDAQIAQAIAQAGLTSQRLNDDDLYRRSAEQIAAGKVVGWFQGRTEFGPRALGNRSIVADPRRADMKDILNSRIKHRESFRPFAPSILEERCSEYFEETYPSPFMLMVYPVKPHKRSEVPAITHVDGSGRLQTVRYQDNPRYWSLIKAFEKLTGVPLVLNTSFNENEPIVNTPQEAIQCFLKTQMDLLVLGNYFIERRNDES